MDPVSGLKGELFRPLVVVLLPGLVASAPFVGILVHRFDILKTLPNSPIATGATILFVGTMAGMFMEDLGSWVEVLIWKIFLKTSKRDREWELYLRLKVKDEFIGQRYLDSVQLRLKFELNMIPALVTTSVGAYFLNARCKLITHENLRWVIAVELALAMYLVLEAVRSSLVLSDTRAEVIAGYWDDLVRGSSSSKRSSEGTKDTGGKAGDSDSGEKEK